MQRFYKAVIYLVACLCANTGFAQDVAFSQFYDQPLLRNPALAGIFEGDLRFTASYRNQWQSVTVPYRTFALSSEVKLPANITADDNFTIGLQLMRDVAGTSEYSTTQILPAINYSLPLSSEKNSYLSLAFMGGLMQQRFDPTKLQFNDQFVAGSNGTFSIAPASQQVFNNTSVNYFDLSTGLTYNGAIREGTDYFVGVALFHIRRPQVGFFDGNVITLNRKFAFNTGLSTPLSEYDRFVFYGDYFQQLGDRFNPVGIHAIQAGAMLSRDFFADGSQVLTGGIVYRMNDAIMPVVQWEMGQFVMGVSYDVNINKLSVASQYRGGLELTLSWRGALNLRQSERRQTICPRFRR
ncbi:PorP/SprF family type IX secretion system membrane protein [Chitinophaga horti]|uniref:PorP/SprF family type IX secretion system membrane protein n=1 Tax=Chitinophaga horti TaxID=2920382 RepID=A0ABY6J4Z1_9BACT|nr:PorP/SprF family type IX secretion system membrane protein [Chitinophaga horti]UYQ94426.1 PorP/SprF family type IX secretion system membrane protein [Chitinophaga horti]